MSEEVLTFEALLAYTGDSGRWQLKIFLLTSIAAFAESLRTFLYIFIAATPEHWCHIDVVNDHESVKNASISRSNGESEITSCSRHDLYYNYTTDNGTNSIKECSSFHFDSSEFESTIVTEWDLVCSKEVWRSTSQAVYFIGHLLGAIVAGSISDSFGRKTAIVWGGLLALLAGTLAGLAPNYWIYLISKFFEAFGIISLYLISSVLVIENVGVKQRGLFGILLSILYAWGRASTAIFAYYIRNWRHLQLITSIPLLASVLLMWFVPESPRWLVSRGRPQDAYEILLKVAKTNGKFDKLPSSFSELVFKLSSIETSSNLQTASLHDHMIDYITLFKTPKLRRRMILLSLSWFAVALIYNGGAFNAPNISDNLFMYTFVSGLLDILSSLIALPVIKFCGRKWTFSSSYFICALTFFLAVFFNRGSTEVAVLSWIGVTFNGIIYGLMYAYAVELIPTLLRSQGTGLAELFAAVGNVMGVYIAGLLSMEPSLLVMSAVSLLATVCALLLPETSNSKLPETIEDVENSEL